MKKIICIVLSLMMCFSIVGCGKKIIGEYCDLEYGKKYFSFYKNIDDYKEYLPEEANNYDGVIFERETKEATSEKLIGIWKLTKNKLITQFYNYLDAAELEIYDNYLVDKNSTYKGNIPDGKTFNAKCKSDNNNFCYIFKEDGKVAKVQYDSKINFGEDYYEFEGTYERDDEIISPIV